MTTKFNEAYEKNLPDPKKRRTPRDMVDTETIKLKDSEGNVFDLQVATKGNKEGKVKKTVAGDVNLYGMKFTQLPPELAELNEIRTLTLNGNPLNDLSNLPPKVYTLTYTATKDGNLKSLAGSPDTKISKLNLYNTDVESFEGMPIVTENIALFNNKKLTSLNGLKVSDKMSSQPLTGILDSFGGGSVEGQEFSREDLIKYLEDQGVEFQSVRGE